MASVTYYVVVPFQRDAEGMLVPGEAKEAPSGESARRRAQAVAATVPHVGAVAFARTGDPDSGDFQEGVVLGTYGEVDVGALQG